MSDTFALVLRHSKPLHADVRARVRLAARARPTPARYPRRARWPRLALKRDHARTAARPGLDPFALGAVGTPTGLINGYLNTRT